ncbi:two-component regulator propeller domain-containing protein [Marispirochaeta sp.]|uniref:two-component regulator propeller domain-containing protein n=1 Tax=Marispirochaeta sp. TaxID=2038653 RepID=UPI0029C752CC|nr:two-component regulator propeller domain-containing protein [Marispirochaeta sp.]
MEDRRGFLWLGTDIGLWRYDGYEFVDYSQIVPEQIDSQIYQDSEGIIWIGSIGGLFAFDPVTEKTVPHKYSSADPDSISAHVFQEKRHAFCEDVRGQLWIATENGLNSYNRSTSAFKAYNMDNSGLLDDSISAVISSRNGMLWVATASGLQKFNPDAGVVEASYSDAPKDITSLCEDPHGVLWIGSNSDGVHRFDPTTEEFTSYRHDPTDSASISSNAVNHLMIPSNTPNALWIATDDAGLNVLDLISGDVDKFSYDPGHPENGCISGNQLTQVIEDNMGSILVVDAFGFLNRFDPGLPRFVKYPGNTRNKEVVSSFQSYSVAQDAEGDIWICEGATAMMYRYDPSDDSSEVQYRLPHYLASPNIGCVADKVNNILWISTKDRIVRFNPRLERVTAEIPADVELLNGITDNVDPDILWFGSRTSGLVKVNTRTSVTKYFTHQRDDPLSVGSSHVLVLAQHADGRIWISVLGAGLQLFDPEREVVTAWYTLNYGAGNPAGLFTDSLGRIWITFHNGGPGLFNPATREFQDFEELTGRAWPARGSTGIIKDERGTFWVSGNGTGEIVQFNPENNATRLYTQVDGIAAGISLSWQGRPVCDVEGGIWISGSGGVTRFFPSRMEDNAYLPSVYITELTQDGVPIETGNAVEFTTELALPPEKNYFEFKASALNYRLPKLNRYRYKLIGWDTHWHDMGTRRTGQYSNLSEGMYILEVEGSNNDGAWCERPARLFIYVEPRVPDSAQLITLDNIRQSRRAILPNDQNTILFEAVPLDFSIVKKKNIEYQLEGYENQWTLITNSRYVRYNKIPVGRYLFKVRDNETGEMSVLPVRIRPPFYRSWWFIGLIGLTVIGIVLVFYRMQIAHLKREKTEELRHQHATQQEELRHVEEEKKLECEKRKAVEAHRESEMRYRDLLATMTEGFIIVNEEGDLSYANERFYEMLGVGKDDIREISLPAFLSAKDWLLFSEIMREHKQGEAQTNEMSFRRTDGNTIGTLVSSKLLKDYASHCSECLAVITDITKLKQSEELLRKREQEIRAEKIKLEETNIALKVLLRKREEDIEEVENRLNQNLTTQVVPYIEKLRRAGLEEKQLLYLDIISANLSGVSSEFSRKLGTRFASLTVQEMHIVNMIREGLATKDIADFLNIAVRTVEIHRCNIRKKLGLVGKKDGLQAYLQRENPRSI